MEDKTPSRVVSVTYWSRVCLGVKNIGKWVLYAVYYSGGVSVAV